MLLSPARVGDLDYSNEMKGMAVTLDLLKARAGDVNTAYRHSLASKTREGLPITPNPFDPAVSRVPPVFY